MKNIYVVVSRRGGLVSDLKCSLTDHPYNHVSISFNEKLNVMYSFGETYKDMPLVGGFITEYPSRILSDGGDVPIRVYTVSYEDEDYFLIRDVIRRMSSRPQKYSYNIYDEALSVFGGGCKIKRAYTDLSFVCKILGLGNVKSIRELEFILSPAITYEGTYNELVDNTNEKHGAEYFNHINPQKAVIKTIISSLKLLGRKVYEMV